MNIQYVKDNMKLMDIWNLKEIIAYPLSTQSDDRFGSKPTI